MAGAGVMGLGGARLALALAAGSLFVGGAAQPSSTQPTTTQPTSAQPIIAGAAAVAGGATAMGPPAAGIWQHHQVTLSYVGITSLFTCSALEDRVRDILLYLGARHDVKTRASGCPGGWNEPSHTAWVDSDFYTLVPSDAAASGSITAQWTRREITPRRPAFMSDGDCELVDQMKDLILKNFAVREPQFRTDCVPNEIIVNGFSVDTVVLIAARPAG